MATALSPSVPWAAPLLPEGPPQTAPVTPDIPPLHQGNLVLDEDAIIQLSAGFGGICRDQVDLVVPCVLREGDRQG